MRDCLWDALPFSTKDTKEKVEWWSAKELEVQVDVASDVHTPEGATATTVRT